MRFMLCIFLTASIYVGTVFGENKALEPEIKNIESATVLVLPMKGSYEQHDEAIEEITEYARRNNIKTTGPIIGIYYDNPELVKEEELKWEIGFFVSSDTRVEKPYIVKELPAGMVASLICVGPYEETGSCMSKLLDFVEKEGVIPAGPVRKIYLTNPDEEKSENYRTEIQLPVVKAK
jgi:AraC family transcriptional regulator